MLNQPAQKQFQVFDKSEVFSSLKCTQKGWLSLGKSRGKYSKPNMLVAVAAGK